MATRERKIEFMESFGGRYTLTEAVTESFRRNGPDWLTDEQLDEIVRARIADWRFTERLNRENRGRRAAQCAQA